MSIGYKHKHYMHLYNKSVQILYGLNINIFVDKECAKVSTLSLHPVVF